MPLQKIGKMSLKNSGGFVTRIQFSYLDDEGNKQLSRQGNDITLGFTDTRDPGDLGVPDGAMVYMHAFVVWGTDNEAKRAFLHEKGNTLGRALQHQRHHAQQRSWPDRDFVTRKAPTGR